MVLRWSLSVGTWKDAGIAWITELAVLVLGSLEYFAFISASDCCLMKKEKNEHFQTSSKTCIQIIINSNCLQKNLNMINLH